jgi:predicted HTH domain antitoxin
VSVTIDLPEELLTGVFNVPERELPRQVLIELACGLYARRALTHAQAAALAGFDRFEFGEQLARRDIPRHYSEDDLAADLTYGGG